jgi:putative GTP pyrophosphokinase
MAMNVWATTEHSLKYKYSGELPEKLRHRLLRAAEAAFLLDREMGIIRDEILEGSSLMAQKHDLGDEILRNIKALYYHNPDGKVAELSQEFLALNRGRNLEKLQDFNQRLRMMAQMYEGVKI